MKHETDQAKVSLERLRSMKLPSVPEHLSKILSITWAGANEVPAVSAVAAQSDKKERPLVTISIVNVDHVYEETMHYNQAMKDFDIFQEVAEEIIQ